MSTIKEMRDLCQQKEMNSKGKMVWRDHWFNTLFTRWFSIYITWLFVRLNITANAVTFLMIIFGLAGVPLLIPHILWLNIIGAIVLMFAVVLDCVDGEVARWNKKSSLRGYYLDLVSHTLCNGIVSSLCALHLFFLTKDSKYLMLAFVVYFISQSRYTLKEEFKIIVSKIPDLIKKESSDAVVKKQTFLKGFIWFLRRLFYFVIDGMSIDHVLVRMLLIICIMFSYQGTLKPMVILSWWLIIAGFIGIVKEIVTKLFIHIPNVEHIK